MTIGGLPAYPAISLSHRTRPSAGKAEWLPDVPPHPGYEQSRNPCGKRILGLLSRLYGSSSRPVRRQHEGYPSDQHGYLPSGTESSSQRAARQEIATVRSLHQAPKVFVPKSIRRWHDGILRQNLPPASFRQPPRTMCGMREVAGWLIPPADHMRFPVHQDIIKRLKTGLFFRTCKNLTCKVSP